MNFVQLNQSYQEDTGFRIYIRARRRNWIEVWNGKRPLEDDKEVENVKCRLQNQSDGSSLVEVDLSLGSSSASPDEQADSQDHDEQADNQNHAGDNSDRSRPFPSINRDSSINSLIRCSRSHYGAIAALNRNFR
ncbi:hypothetical protein BC332_34702 [Capsicum chinense]|nr:hypothetical protein BC332_34702 [Capsicum chinense]